jgi:predicted mannosyl-3-phosphoglycerate phosphatase (HAD superfamily)
MSLAKANEYTFVKFERSKDSKKKYDAILKNNKTSRLRRISFGAKGYEQYKDSTGKKLYTHVDHLDEERRRLYRKRHAGEGDPSRKYSAGWFSWHYLW